MTRKPQGILFNGPMIKAILAGRKTVTRRLVKPQPMAIYELTDATVAIHRTNEFQDYFENNPMCSKQRLSSGQRWEDIFEDSIRWTWEKGLRGMVSVGGVPKQGWIPPCVFVPQEYQNNQNGAPIDLLVVSRSSPKPTFPNSSSGRQSEKQSPNQPSMGNSGGKLSRQTNSRNRSNWRTSSKFKNFKRNKVANSVGNPIKTLQQEATREEIGAIIYRNLYGPPFQIGQTLYVKETFNLCGGKPFYLADGAMHKDWKWKPSIFMPKWAARIWLEVLTVSVEGLQDIGKDGRKAKDVLAEGITEADIDHWRKWLHPDDAPAYTYGELWNSINGKTHPWKSNPWVWRIEFKRVERPGE